MIITVLSRDKIAQNIFKSAIKNIQNYVIVGTHSNQDVKALEERLKFVETQTKDVIIFHALKRSVFAISKEWNPEATADYPKQFDSVSDVLVYTPSMLQMTHGRELTVLKGDEAELQKRIDAAQIS